ncbi:hypothetical protein ACP70R_041987 [Stipagrostis hirtigluma subsp. patula]
MAEHKEEPLVESVVDKISDKLHGGDPLSSSSAATMKAKIYRLFSRKKPVHSVLGVGKCGLFEVTMFAGVEAKICNSMGCEKNEGLIVGGSKPGPANKETMGGATTSDVSIVVLPTDGSNVTPATNPGPVRTQEDHSRIPASPPHRPSAGAPEKEGPSVLDLALFAYSASVILGILADAKGLVDGWGVVPKVSYGVVIAVAMASTAVGFMSAGCGPSPMEPNRKLSGLCARLGAIATTALLVVAMACKLGGCFGGVAAAAVIALTMAGVWVWSEPAMAQGVSSFWTRLWRRDAPVLPQ